MEGAVNTAVIKLLKTLPLHFEIVGHIDFRAKLQIIKSVAFVSMKNEKWFKDIEEIINIIDNDLRVARNRMIHDMWYLPFESIESAIRIGFTPKLKRQRSRERALEHEILSISPEEILAFSGRVIYTTRDLLKLVREIPKSASPLKS